MNLMGLQRNGKISLTAACVLQAHENSSGINKPPPSIEEESIFSRNIFARNTFSRLRRNLFTKIRMHGNFRKIGINVY